MASELEKSLRSTAGDSKSTQDFSLAFDIKAKGPKKLPHPVDRKEARERYTPFLETLFAEMDALQILPPSNYEDSNKTNIEWGFLNTYISNVMLKTIHQLKNEGVINNYLDNLTYMAAEFFVVGSGNCQTSSRYTFMRLLENIDLSSDDYSSISVPLDCRFVNTKTGKIDHCNVIVNSYWDPNLKRWNSKPISIMADYWLHRFDIAANVIVEVSNIYPEDEITSLVADIEDLRKYQVHLKENFKAACQKYEAAFLANLKDYPVPLPGKMQADPFQHNLWRTTSKKGQSHSFNFLLNLPKALIAFRKRYLLKKEQIKKYTNQSLRMMREIWTHLINNVSNEEALKILQDKDSLIFEKILVLRTPMILKLKGYAFACEELVKLYHEISKLSGDSEQDYLKTNVIRLLDFLLKKDATLVKFLTSAMQTEIQQLNTAKPTATQIDKPIILQTDKAALTDESKASNTIQQAGDTMLSFSTASKSTLSNSVVVSTTQNQAKPALN